MNDVRFFRVTAFCAIAAFAYGCGETESPSSEESRTIAQAITSTCTPDSDYDTCLEIELSRVEEWQSTLQNPAWRTVSSVSEPDIDYQVIIDVNALNGGVIPTASGQGHYADEAEYLAVKSDLLGVDVTAHNFILSVIGTSVKLAADGGPTRSTGVFLYDALSDEDGEIWINGQNRTDDLINRDRTHNFTQEVDGQGTMLASSISLMNTDPWLPQIVDYALLQSNNWEADLFMLRRDFQLLASDVVVPGKVIVEISGVQRNSFACKFKWHKNPDFWSGLLRRHCNVAHELYAAVQPTWWQSFGITYPAPASDSAVHASFWFVSRQPAEACGYGAAVFTIQPLDGSSAYVFTPNSGPSVCNL